MEKGAAMNHTVALRPAWTPLNIVLMVAGFVIFWPLGLAMLAYILWGPQIRDAFGDMRRQFHGQRSYATGNVAFDEYRRRELDRLAEERRRLERDRAEFEEYVRNLRRAKDQEEFDRFMAEHTRSRPGPSGPSV
jgi:hypothetical protein